MTNLVINTNMRTYHMELRSTERTYMASVSWQYPQDQLIALRRQNAEAQAAQPVASGVDLANVNFRYAIEGDRAPWRPLRAPSTTDARSLSSFRAASVRARCRHSSSSAPRATPLSS
jgi:type IV secretory pathway VirB9-like protein